jgi:ParB family chromosome partitioning protein
MTNHTIQKKRGLSRGLSHLLSENTDQQHLPSQPNSIITLPVEKLQSGKYQPRHTFDKEPLEELADSIRAQGILQPILVRKLAGLKYEIIAGERRYRAAKIAGLLEVPVIVRNIPDESAVAIALIENIQRENLNAMEEAHALKRLQDEFRLTQQQVATAVGKSRVNITHLLRLLDLHPEVQQYLQTGEIEKGHAKTLLGLKLSDQLKACKIITTKNLSVRETERLIQQWPTTTSLTNAKTTQPKISDPNIRALEKRLSDKLSTTVSVQHNTKKGRGKLVIHYRNLDALDWIIGKLKP